MKKLIVIAMLLASCSNLTTTQKNADIAAVESFALNTALNVGTSYLTSGSITPAVIAGSIDGAAQTIRSIEATNAASNPAAIQPVLASGSTSSVVNTKIVPPVAAKAVATIQAGNDPNAVIEAVATGLNTAAAQLNAKSP